MREKQQKSASFQSLPIFTNCFLKEKKKNKKEKKRKRKENEKEKKRKNTDRLEKNLLV